jgi:arsenate reductase-like glutaredoxin family protein
LLKSNGAFEERDLGKQPLSEAELDALIGARPHGDFLNTKNELYRTMGMKQNPPTRARALKLMAKEPNLIKRPIFCKGAKTVLGFDPEKVAELL